MSRRVLLPARLSSFAEQGPNPGAVVQRLRGSTMGTSWSVSLTADPGCVARPSLEQCLQAELDDVVAQMSHWETASILSRFNHAPAGSRHILPKAFFEVLCCAVDLAQVSEGAFDPAMGALVDAWGFGARPREARPPKADMIIDAQERSGWRRLEFDRVSRTIKQPGGLALDLSGIAKGYAVDRLCEALQQAGIDHFLCEVGGELRGQGCKPDRQPWWVALESVPGGSADGVSPLRSWALALDGLAVATSGDYQRYFEHAGRRYAHTLDPKTGYPVNPAPAAVSVIHTSCMMADGLATVLTVLGLQDGMDFAEREGIAALFVLRGAQGRFDEYASTAWARMQES